MDVGVERGRMSSHGRETGLGWTPAQVPGDQAPPLPEAAPKSRPERGGEREQQTRSDDLRHPQPAYRRRLPRTPAKVNKAIQGPVELDPRPKWVDALAAEPGTVNRLCIWNVNHIPTRLGEA